MRLTILFMREKWFSRKTHNRFTRSILADWLSNKQETRRPKETQFSWEKKYSIKGKIDWLWTPRNITSPDGSCCKAIDSSISQNIFSYLKMFSMQFRKSMTVEDSKKRMNIANFINIYTSIYNYILCDENNSK